MSLDGGTDGEAFRTYVGQVLAPHLRPGRVALMDNLKAHRVAGIRGAIEATGARGRALPPYSPDLSPMELARSKLKTAPRGRAARTREAAGQAWTAVLPQVAARDALHWFTPRGYCAAPN